MDDQELSNYCNQTFVILDKWLSEVGAKKGDEALVVVKKALENNIKANITYYESLAGEAEKNGLSTLASRNRLLARLYSGLL